MKGDYFFIFLFFKSSIALEGGTNGKLKKKVNFSKL